MPALHSNRPPPCAADSEGSREVWGTEHRVNVSRAWASWRESRQPKEFPRVRKSALQLADKRQTLGPNLVGRSVGPLESSKLCPESFVGRKRRQRKDPSEASNRRRRSYAKP